VLRTVSPAAVWLQGSHTLPLSFLLLIV